MPPNSRSSSHHRRRHDPCPRRTRLAVLAVDNIPSAAVGSSRPGRLAGSRLVVDSPAVGNLAVAGRSNRWQRLEVGGRRLVVDMEMEMGRRRRLEERRTCLSSWRLLWL
jgi:hypothetical protein